MALRGVRGQRSVVLTRGFRSGAVLREEEGKDGAAAPAADGEGGEAAPAVGLEEETLEPLVTDIYMARLEKKGVTGRSLAEIGVLPSDAFVEAQVSEEGGYIWSGDTLALKEGRDEDPTGHFKSMIAGVYGSETPSDVSADPAEGMFADPNQRVTGQVADLLVDVRIAQQAGKLSLRKLEKLFELEDWSRRYSKWVEHEKAKTPGEDDFAAIMLAPPEYIGNARLQYSAENHHFAQASMQQVHPAQRKVSLTVSVPAMQLDPDAEARLLELCGSRYCPRSRNLKIISRKHQTRLQNRVHVRLVLDRLLKIAAAGEAEQDAVIGEAYKPAASQLA